MNPMMRWAYAIHDAKDNQLGERVQRKRDAHKVKLREEKEMRRLDAIERDNKRRTGQKSPSPEKEGAEEPKMEETAACKFQKELCWCIQQLEMGLDNKKAGSQKAPEAVRLLKILKSSKAPMARKRQVMRASFGNYRARMQQEEKKHSEDMVKGKSFAPVECEKLSSATFFRKASSSMSPSSYGGPRYCNIQPVIPEMGNEESETETNEQGAHKVESDGPVEEEEEDILMKSLELETMDMHLCKSEDAHVARDAGDDSQSAAFQHDEQPLIDNKMALHSLKRLKKEREMEEEENEKENIPSRTPTDTDDTNHSQVSSTFSSCASLFSFNFEIKEEDMDVLGGSRPFAAHPPKSDGLESHHMMRGLDNRASDSTSSSGGTPTKRASRKRNRGKRKQQQQKQNEDIQQSDSKTSPKEALLTESPKIELAAKEGFKFDFPEPVET
ncbi:uncharacterized protein LOC100888117 [Strongylocentrotus purpuratus]|uniref:Uncharacterized protein n=1 Tax=Strongylocentrotus purpuratus TaxID=7668 RepID=A0A7M7NWQ1_STRPU|nr:uncharacterized protein LOC100888117 [Strongylocentrotus purpuratus]